MARTDHRIVKGKQSRAGSSHAQALDNDFEAVAKRLDCDEDKGRFEAKLGKIARAASKPTVKKER
jgi:hypothetical protein